MGRLVVFCPSPSVPVVLVVETTVSDAERAARAVSKKTFTSTGNVTNTESKRQHASASGAGTSCSLSLVSLSPVTNENAFANRVAREVSFFPRERVLSDLFVWTVNNAPARFFCPFFSKGQQKNIIHSRIITADRKAACDSLINQSAALRLPVR